MANMGGGTAAIVLQAYLRLAETHGVFLLRQNYVCVCARVHNYEKHMQRRQD